MKGFPLFMGMAMFVAGSTPAWADMIQVGGAEHELESAPIQGAVDTGQLDPHTGQKVWAIPGYIRPTGDGKSAELLISNVRDIEFANRKGDVLVRFLINFEYMNGFGAGLGWVYFVSNRTSLSASGVANMTGSVVGRADLKVYTDDQLGPGTMGITAMAFHALTDIRNQWAEKPYPTVASERSTYVGGGFTVGLQNFSRTNSFLGGVDAFLAVLKRVDSVSPEGNEWMLYAGASFEFNLLKL